MQMVANGMQLADLEIAPVPKFYTSQLKLLLGKCFHYGSCIWGVFFKEKSYPVTLTGHL